MILIVGAGNMAQEYIKVIKTLGHKFLVVGRSEHSAKIFNEATGIMPVLGGLDNLCTQDFRNSKFAIVTTGVEQLYSTTLTLIDQGIKKILVEKPAGLNVDEITALAKYAAEREVDVFVAYNRRFYSSLLAAKEIIDEDGGVKSFNFELTEWGHVIATLEKGEGVKENWFLANTTHVTDMAFFLGGFPEQLSYFCNGEATWHSRSYNFAGAGVSQSGALFSYSGNWGAPGRWSIEVLTSFHRLIFRPMEKLQIQKLGSVSIEYVDIDDSLDINFKPGLYKQVVAFISNDTQSLCSLQEQSEAVNWYAKIAGYTQ